MLPVNDLANVVRGCGLSLLSRFRSRQEESYSARVIAALRNQFGGHAIREANRLAVGEPDQ